MIVRISDNGLAKLKQWEGCKLKAYRDVAGVKTIGFGHTGNDVKDGMEITMTEATRLLIKDLSRFEAAVSELVKVDLKPNQRDALISFAFNVGIGSFKGSTLLKKLNKGDYDSVPKELMKWVKASNEDGEKVTVPGLVNRRSQEAALWGLGEFVSSNTVVAQKPAGPHKDVAVIGAGGLTATVSALGESIPDITNAVSSQQSELTSGDWVRIAIGVIILSLTIYGIYRRIKA